MIGVVVERHLRLIERNGSMSNPKEKSDLVLLLKLLKIATLTDDVEKEEDDQFDDKVEILENSGKNNVSIESTFITNIGKVFLNYKREKEMTNFDIGNIADSNSTLIIEEIEKAELVPIYFILIFVFILSLAIVLKWWYSKMRSYRY